MTQKAIALLRVSSEAQAGSDRQGLPGQRRTVEQIARTHGLKIIDEVQIHVSGAKVLEDSRFRALLDRIQDPKIAGVVVADLDRLMRPEDPGYYSIFRRFRDSETVLYTSSGAKDFRTDRLLMVLEAEIAALERQRIAERTRRGREERRRQGRKAEGVGLPRAVTFDQATGVWAYAFPEATQVREAFRLFLGSHGTMSFAEIKRRTGLGRESGPRDNGTISRLLSNKLYAGIYRVDRRWRDGKPYPRAEHEILEMQVLDPPLIDLADWERVQELRRVKRARRAPRKPHEQQGGTYTGFLECALCGASIWIALDSKDYRGYCCANQRDRHCPTGQTSIRKVDPQIDLALEERLGSETTLRRLIERAAEESAKRAEAPPGETAARISKLHNQRERALDAYTEGAFELPELKKRLAKIDGEIALLNDLLARQPEEVQVDEAMIRDLATVFSCWRDLKASEKRSLLTAYQMRLRISRPERGRVSVDEILIGLVDSPEVLRLYKKLKRHGMQ